MEESIKQNGKDRHVRKNKQERKYLNMILEGRLKDPSPPIIEKISAELGMDLPIMINK